MQNKKATSSAAATTTTINRVQHIVYNALLFVFILFGKVACCSFFFSFF